MLDIISSADGVSRKLSLVGELDIATIDIFKNSVEEARRGAGQLILDMEKLSFVDSTGVGGLLNVIKNLKKSNIEVKVSNVSEEVFEVFDLLGLPMLLGEEIFEKGS